MATISNYKTRAGGTRYRVRYRTPDRRQTDKRGFPTKRDAEQFAATVEVAKLRGEYVPPALGRELRMGELGPGWLDRQRGHMKPSGFRSYESAWRVHVEPRWGRAGCAEIRFTAVQAWVSQFAAKRGAVVVQTAYSVLARILDDAVQDRLLASNPARGVKLPKRPPRRNVYLTADQLDKLAAESGRYGSLVLLLGVGGLGWGQAVALRVGDVDFLRRRIELHRNAMQVGTKVVVGTLKSMRIGQWCCLSSSLRHWLKLPRARVATICSGRRHRAGTWGRPHRRSHGYPVRLNDAESPIPHSPESRLMRCDIPQPRWRLALGRTRRSSSACTPVRR